MGNNISSTVSKYVSYEDAQNISKNSRTILINTLKNNEQGCLIQNTLSVEKVEFINRI